MKENIEERASFELAHPAIITARELLADSRALILDTETTGLGYSDEIIDVALINLNGEAVLNTLMQCKREDIPPAATRVHGIDKAALLDAPLFTQVWPYLEHLLVSHTIIIYNAAYDTRLIEQTARLYGIKPPMSMYGARCLMLTFSEYIAVPSFRSDGYQYQSLAAACIHFEIEQTGAHRALADCLTSLEVLKRLAAVEE